MSLVIKFYFTSYVLNMFRTFNTSIIRSLRLFYCITTLVVFLFRCVLEFRCATRIPPQPNHTETPTHIEIRTHNQCGDTIEKSQAPDDGCIKCPKHVEHIRSEIKLNKL